MTSKTNLNSYWNNFCMDDKQSWTFFSFFLLNFCFCMFHHIFHSNNKRLSCDCLETSLGCPLINICLQTFYSSILWGNSIPWKIMSWPPFEYWNFPSLEWSISSLKFKYFQTKPDTWFNNIILDEKGYNTLISELCLKCENRFFSLE